MTASREPTAVRRDVSAADERRAVRRAERVDPAPAAPPVDVRRLSGFAEALEAGGGDLFVRAWMARDGSARAWAGGGAVVFERRERLTAVGSPAAAAAALAAVASDLD
ncbi:MAG: hypothetical protein M3Q27_12505, partial [Actinomycetota bacterium]|nr:hypothetical protein [Actinomycetota bacterium]